MFDSKVGGVRERSFHTGAHWQIWIRTPKDWADLQGSGRFEEKWTIAWDAANTMNELNGELNESIKNERSASKIIN